MACVTGIEIFGGSLTTLPLGYSFYRRGAMIGTHIMKGEVKNIIEMKTRKALISFHLTT